MAVIVIIIIITIIIIIIIMIIIMITITSIIIIIIIIIIISLVETAADLSRLWAEVNPKPVFFWLFFFGFQINKPVLRIFS